MNVRAHFRDEIPAGPRPEALCVTGRNILRNVHPCGPSGFVVVFPLDEELLDPSSISRCLSRRSTEYCIPSLTLSAMSTSVVVLARDALSCWRRVHTAICRDPLIDVITINRGGSLVIIEHLIRSDYQSCGLFRSFPIGRVQLEVVTWLEARMNSSDALIKLTHVVSLRPTQAPLGLLGRFI